MTIPARRAGGKRSAREKKTPSPVDFRGCPTFHAMRINEQEAGSILSRRRLSLRSSAASSFPDEPVRSRDGSPIRVYSGLTVRPGGKGQPADPMEGDVESRGEKRGLGRYRKGTAAGPARCSKQCPAEERADRSNAGGNPGIEVRPRHLGRGVSFCARRSARGLCSRNHS